MSTQDLNSVASSKVSEAVAHDGKSEKASELLKRSCDLFLSLVFSIVGVPVILIGWLLVRATSTGPGFYFQNRVGRWGKSYRIYKLRTMAFNCEATSGAAWSAKRDPRVTPIGRIFRKLHIDELPQLWNVIRGDMSLIGPRPERPEFVGPLSDKIPGYRERLAVKPGVTGLAQIQLPPDTNLDSVRSKLVLDRCYIQERGFWLDARIILGTMVYLMGFSYSTVRKLLRLPNPLVEDAYGTDDASHLVGSYSVLGLFHSRLDDGTSPRPLTNEGGPVPCSEAP